MLRFAKWLGSLALVAGLTIAPVTAADTAQGTLLATVACDHCCTALYYTCGSQLNQCDEEWPLCECS